ncbi:MAG: tetratricopeptide repeat protein [Bdellovibrionota bacterium]
MVLALSTSVFGKPLPVEDDNLDIDPPKITKGKKTTAAPAADTGEPPIALEARKFFKQKQYSKVINSLWPKAAELPAKSLVLLAQAYAEEKKWSDVMKVCELGLARFPSNSDLLTLRAMALIETNQERLASEDLKSALVANPKNEKAYQLTANMYEKRKNMYELRLIYQDMIDHIGPKPAYFAALCKINTMDGVNDAAQQSCAEALKRNPKDIESTVNLAQIHKQIGQTEEAEKILRKVSSANPKSEVAQESMGRFLEDKKNYMESIPFYEKCLVANPVSETCLMGSINSNVQIQKFEEAEKKIKLLCKQNRKFSVEARKAAATARSFKNFVWEKNFTRLGEQCSL